MTDDVEKPTKRKRKRPPPPLPIGEVINGYRLTSIVGRGGMGTVYLGKHEILGREAAVKVLAKDLWDDEEFVSRFFHEAKVANNINHPNIVDILDFVHDENPKRIAYIMELVKGPTLKQVLKDHRLSLEQTINVIAQLGQALQEAHRAGVIHRDLKPANILVVEPLDTDLSILPSVKLLDFGIAKITQGAVGHQTMQGTVLGTPKYMAPEQISAEAISPATDVYALGEIFFEMAAGHRVYNGANNVIMAHKLSGNLPELSCPDDLRCAKRVRKLTADCLAADPARRITLVQFATELLSIRSELGIDTDVPLARRRQSHITGEYGTQPLPESAGPGTLELSTATSPPRRAPQKSSPTMLIASITVVLLTIIAGAFLLFSRGHPVEESSETDLIAQQIPSITATAHSKEKESKPMLTSVVLTSTPAAVDVITVRGAKNLGQTPLTVRVSPDAPLKLVLQTVGFEPLPVSINGNRTHAHYELHPVAAAPAPKKKSPRRRPASSPPDRDILREEQSDDTSPMKKQDLPTW
jgi:eukaryotic-like serine/threonine-protein kinase